VSDDLDIEEWSPMTTQPQLHQIGVDIPGVRFKIKPQADDNLMVRTESKATNAVLVVSTSHRSDD